MTTEPKPTDPGAVPGEPKRYEFVELFGHNCLGPCEVQEVQRYGATFCEARPLNLNGTPGDPQLIAGSAIYRVQPITEEMAKMIAARRLNFIPALPDRSSVDPPPPPDGDDDHGDDDDEPGFFSETQRTELPSPEQPPL